MSEVKNKLGNRLGFISKSKDGKKSLLNVEQEMTLRPGDRLIIEKPADEINSLVARGKMSEEKAQEVIAKIPSWKLSNVKLLPRTQE